MVFAKHRLQPRPFRGKDTEYLRIVQIIEDTASLFGEIFVRALFFARFFVSLHDYLSNIEQTAYNGEKNRNIRWR